MPMTTRSALLTAAVCSLLGFAAASSAADSKWQPLFNGKNLDGWTHVGDGSFVVENGQLKTQGGMGLRAYTKEQFKDVTYRIVYRAPDPLEAGNSGVFIRIPERPTEAWMPVNRGYEVQIDETDDDYHRTGVLYSFTQALAKPAVKDWNVMEITLDGDHTVVTVNGEKVTDYREGQPVPEKKQSWEPDRGRRSSDAGYFGLQNHSDKDVVYFKEVSVRRN